GRHPGRRRRPPPDRAPPPAKPPPAGVDTLRADRPSLPSHAQPPAPPTQTLHRLLAGQIPTRLPTAQRVVALTFDAGADNAGAPKILATLARPGATATFFMTGRWVELYPQWAKRIAARYPIANHTFNHL